MSVESHASQRGPSLGPYRDQLSRDAEITIRAERSLRWVVPAEYSLPDLLPILSSVQLSVEQDRVTLRSVYFDTDEMVLARNGITLRHRTGTIDVGWELTLPEDGLRRQIAAPFDDESVPPALRALLVGFTRHSALVPVLSLEIVRDEQRLMAPDGSLVIIVNDDAVRPQGGAPVAPWREIEVVLGPSADNEVVQRVRSVLGQSGAEPSAESSKLLFARGGDRPAAEPIDHTARGLLLARLRDLQSAVMRGDLEARLGGIDLHGLHAAFTSLRNTLTVFEDLGLDPDGLTAGVQSATLPVNAFAASAAVQGRLRRAAATVPYELDPHRHAVSRLDAFVSARLAHLRTVVQEGLDTADYLSVIGRLSDWIADLPASLGEVADTTVVDLVAQALEAALVLARDAVDNGAEPDALAAASAAAARAQDGAEVARVLLPTETARRVTQAAAIGRQLGEVHEAHRAAQTLREVAGEDATDAFVLGVVYAHVLADADLTLRRAKAALRRIDAG